MRFDIITIFPEIFTGFLSGGIIRRAVAEGLLEICVHDLRDFAAGRHRQVDDRPFGGLEGMVIKPEPVFCAVESLRRDEEAAVYLLSAQGTLFSAETARRMARLRRVILICGRYEGVDERVAEHLADEEISIGDYVLTGGEPAAMVVVDAVSRFVPGVVGKTGSVERDSFNDGLLDYPQYTRPRDFRGLAVPDVLLSGDHAAIEEWRRKKAMEKTARTRPDLLKKTNMDNIDKERTTS
ncbi:MAG: tRNA (guanosine(37)-N1)-methyltransferase TrmD [Acidobacteriota bacterium]|nr:tRNA (guanosine(37)-N1)-methyltransferase TrmD [Acidobacteriota bacterium]